ncbi:hypothetical protein [Piscirickettsia litoralis]|uniref:Uncharacterized protein n=1 Tax=Piscirickettsia litoralis TaxID=1891921 RepID=A0ABX3A7F0_9GAMM|nr:hypothetical protein [Piscirickettsia litoralis]ODN43360.1 hypothetical protein BGC07_11040 [Piscirickettsia litoralis]
MTDVKTALQPYPILSHSLLPGYCLPNIQLSRLDHTTINLASLTQNQHYVLIFLEATTSTRFLNKLHQTCEKYQQTLHALDSQLAICFTKSAACTSIKITDHKLSDIFSMTIAS